MIKLFLNIYFIACDVTNIYNIYKYYFFQNKNKVNFYSEIYLYVKLALFLLCII